MEKIIETLKNLSGLAKSGLGLLAFLIGTVIVLRDNFHLTIVVTIALVTLAGLVAYLLLGKEMRPPELVRRVLPKRPKFLFFGGLGLLAVLAGEVYFFTSPSGKALLAEAFRQERSAPDSSPTFEINLIGLPYPGDEAYYVTDAMIRTGGDLSAYPDFKLTPLQVEIIPKYKGEEKFANLVLRLAGAQKSQDIKLWDEFDNRSGSKTIVLSLGEIIALSGIQESRSEIETSLGLGDQPYQQANLKLQIVRLSNANIAWGEKLLVVKNTPWTQTARMVNRNGLLVDYAFKNWGPDAKFHCHLAVAKTRAEVGLGDHAYWSGIGESADVDCTPFELKSGEAQAKSVLLDSQTIGHELEHGRYLVQVYTFAERADVVFQGGKSYETSSQTWVLANAAHVLTYVLCYDPGKTCEQTETLPVEEKAIRVFPYNSADEWANGVTNFQTRTYPVNNHSANQYILEYWIDPQKTGWVGFGIWFETPADLSEYHGLRFKLILDKSLHPFWLDIKGKIGDSYKTARVGIGNGAYSAAQAEEQVISIPFSAFEGLDWKTIDTIYFGIDSFQVPDAEKHEIRVSEIEFIR